MEDSSGNGLFMQNISIPKGARFVNIPALDKEMLAKQSTIIVNNDKHFSSQDAYNLREDGVTNLVSPTSTAGLMTTEPSPSFHPFIHASNRPIVMAVTKMEQNYMQTRLMLQQCSRHVLLGVILSLVDEYPTTLVEPVRQRLEQLLSNRPGGGGGGGGGGIVPGNGRGAQSPNASTSLWSSPQAMQGGSPMFTAPTPTPTPTQTHRKGRGHRNKEDEQELCSVHHCMRVMKHLQINHATGLYECVHGFHCLVDGPSEAAVPTPNPPVGKETPNSDGLTQTTPSLPYISPTHREGEGRLHTGYNPSLAMEATGNGGVTAEGGDPFGCKPLMKHFPRSVNASATMLMDGQTDGGYPVEEDTALDVHSLTNLLKSVRAMETEE